MDTFFLTANVDCIGEQIYLVDFRLHNASFFPASYS